MGGGKTLKEKILELLRDKGPLTLKELHGFLPQHTYRGVCGRVYELVSRGDVVKLEKGKYGLAEENTSQSEEEPFTTDSFELSPIAKKLKALQELAALDAEDLRVLSSMALTGMCTLQELEDEAGESASRVIERLEKGGFVRLKEDNTVSLSAKGVYVASFIHAYLNMVLRSSTGEPTLKDAQLELYRLAGILEALVQNRDVILSSLENMRVAAESLSKNAMKLSRLIPSQ
jgi:hypothetical protein